MKNKRTIVLVVAITVAIAIIIGLYVAGFRITYNPDLITDWDAVSGCAAWAGVIASVVAIWYAIQVPKKIADRQDKIALFEKRYAIYRKFMQCNSYAKLIMIPCIKVKNYRIVFMQVFCPAKVFQQPPSTSDIMNQLLSVMEILGQTKFYFDPQTDKKLQIMYALLEDFLGKSDGIDENELIEKRDKFVNYLNSIIEDCKKEMEDKMILP